MDETMESYGVHEEQRSFEVSMVRELLLSDEQLFFQGSL